MNRVGGKKRGIMIYIDRCVWPLVSVLTHHMDAGGYAPLKIFITLFPTALFNDSVVNLLNTFSCLYRFFLLYICCSYTSKFSTHIFPPLFDNIYSLSTHDELLDIRLFNPQDVRYNIKQKCTNLLLYSFLPVV